MVFWSRKAANTSLSNWLAEVLVNDQAISLDRQGARAALKQGFHVDADVGRDLVLNEGYQDFILARDPYRRAVSAFVEKFVYYGEKPLSAPHRLKNFAQQAFIEMMAVQGRPATWADHVINYRGPTFLEFAQYLADRVRNPGEDGEPELNGHWNTQVPLTYSGRFTYTNVIHLERIATEIGPLAERLETEVPFPHARPNAPAGEVESSKDLATTPVVDLIEAGVIPGAGALLTADTIPLLREAFALDFALLGYDADRRPGS